MEDSIAQLLVAGGTVVGLGTMVAGYYAHLLNHDGTVKSHLDGWKYCLTFAKDVDFKDYDLSKNELHEKYPQLQKFLRPYNGNFSFKSVSKKDNELYCLTKH